MRETLQPNEGHGTFGLAGVPFGVPFLPANPDIHAVRLRHRCSEVLAFSAIGHFRQSPWLEWGSGGRGFGLRSPPLAIGLMQERVAAHAMLRTQV